MTLSARNALSVDEGSIHTYSYTSSDPGVDTFVLLAESCGANGTLSNSVFSTATGAGSFDCTFPDGDDTSRCRSRSPIPMVPLPTPTPRT